MIFFSLITTEHNFHVTLDIRQIQHFKMFQSLSLHFVNCDYMELSPFQFCETSSQHQSKFVRIKIRIWYYATKVDTMWIDINTHST